MHGKSNDSAVNQMKNLLKISKNGKSDVGNSDDDFIIMVRYR